jgi:hypothetical protein
MEQLLCHWYASLCAVLYYRELADSEEAQSVCKRIETDGDHQDNVGEKLDDAKKAEDDETEKCTGEDNDTGDGKPASTKQWSKSQLMKEYRKFNLDLAPKVILKELLICISRIVCSFIVII